ncbi:MAG: RNA polymerase sigma factor [Actinomycetota bacterium]|nr:RNA polymerase sigma factor [Actinomycetota bacterium]
MADLAMDDPASRAGGHTDVSRREGRPAIGRLRNGPDESALVSALREGSEAAFALLVSRHQRGMLRVAGFYVSSSATAVDVVQETWVQILRDADAFVGGASVKMWIYRVLISRAKSAGRTEGRTVAVEDMAAVEVADDRPGVPSSRFHDAVHPTRPLEWKSPPQPWEPDMQRQLVSAGPTVDLVSGAINELPPAQKLIITLRDVECWTSTEVCSVLGLSETNQRVLLHRARCGVRLLLEDHFVGR